MDSAAQDGLNSRCHKRDSTARLAREAEPESYLRVVVSRRHQPVPLRHDAPVGLGQVRAELAQFVHQTLSQTAPVPHIPG